MPLDPQAQLVLDQLAAVGMPDFDSVDPVTARNLSAAGVVPSTESIARVEDRVIPGPDGEIGVRVFTPDAAGPLPVLSSSTAAAG